ncbi:MAG TPA: alpha/beta hydrolase-fold protein [Longimicrobium sp.]
MKLRIILVIAGAMLNAAVARTAQAQPDTRTLAPAIGRWLADSLLDRMADDSPFYINTPTTPFDSVVAAGMQASHRTEPAGAPRPAQHEWVATHGFTLRGDTAAVAVEMGTTKPGEGGAAATTYVEQHLYLFVPAGSGWRFVRRTAMPEPVPPHEIFTMESAAVGETRRIAVYLPPGYAESGAAHYPLLYMPDGGVQEDFSHVASTVDAGIRAGEMRPMIVVGIENTRRRRDMTGPTQVEEDRLRTGIHGGSAAFRRFIADELIPEVERRYRVTDQSAIIGESLAGLFIVETFFLQPELFDTWIALSPSLWWNAGELVRRAEERLRARPDRPEVLYLSSADEEEIVSTTTRLAEVLRANASPALRWQYTPRPDLTHATIYRGAAPGVLRDLFPPCTAGRC